MGTEPLLLNMSRSDDLCVSNWDADGEGLYAINGGILALLKRSGMTDASDLHISGFPGPFRR